MFLQPDGTFFVQLINFAIFFAILELVFLRPVGKAIARRRAYIDSVTEDYDRYQAEGTERKREAEALRAAARRDAEAEIAQSRARASNAADEIGARHAREAAEEIQRAHETVAAEVAAAHAEQSGLAAELGELMVERTVGSAS